MEGNTVLENDNLLAMNISSHYSSLELFIKFRITGNMFVMSEFILRFISLSNLKSPVKQVSEEIIYRCIGRHGVTEIT